MNEHVKTRSVITHMKLRLAIAATLNVFAALIPAVRSSGVAQSNNEREFEDKVPKHLPIKMRIHPDREKAAKDPDNDRWQLILGEGRGIARPEDVPIKPNETILLSIDKVPADGGDKTSKLETCHSLIRSK